MKKDKIPKYCNISKSGKKKCVKTNQKTKFIHQSNADSGNTNIINTKIQNIRPNMKVILKKTPITKRVEVEGPSISSPSDAAGALRDIVKADREEFRALHLNTRKKVIGTELLSKGVLDSALVHPRETFKGAILNNSSAIIVAHNHPSGDSSPSSEDIKVCKDLKKGGEIIGIPVLDCLVIGKKNYTSINDLM